MGRPGNSVRSPCLSPDAHRSRRGKSEVQPGKSDRQEGSKVHEETYAAQTLSRSCGIVNYGRYSGFRVILAPTPSHPRGQWHRVGLVTGYSSATATDFHRLPCLANYCVLVPCPPFLTMWSTKGGMVSDASVVVKRKIRFQMKESRFPQAHGQGE